MAKAGDLTLAAYERAADLYVARSRRPASVLPYLDRLADHVGEGTVLEIGSGPGWDADHLEARGCRVVRTDAAAAFVDRLRAAGHPARLLDVRVDPLGGPYDAVLANAVLLHLTRDEFADVLLRAWEAVTEDGVLGFTLREGDGDAWSEHKLGLPRHFTYWQAPDVVDVLARCGWDVLSVDRVEGRPGPWLMVLARARPEGCDRAPDLHGRCREPHRSVR